MKGLNHYTGIALTATELNDAEMYWMKYTQKVAVSEEIMSLTKGERLNSNSTILTLNPFLQETRQDYKKQICLLERKTQL